MSKKKIRKIEKITRGELKKHEDLPYADQLNQLIAISINKINEIIERLND